ncbi:hypothetical protein [Polaromonas sp. YR568]|uniref:hypothetical protein n=1 Tax=Polaromonas sp. YR568 TaxID=1855301 RepID=UPI000B899915|nr:hypothetical protein [Polaromonas sp. YR568]
MAAFRRPAAALFLGALVAVLAALLGPLLDAPAIARWTVQSYEEEGLRAAFALIGVRHLPMLLLAIAAGNVVFRLLKSTSFSMVAISAIPWLLYVVVTGTMESIAVGESPFSWVGYEPAYFIWPHFVAVPLGLYTASRMVRQRLAKAAPN